MKVMNVFIGWLGEASKEIASSLESWLNGMFDGRVSAYTTMDNLAAGSEWFHGLRRAMNDADCGLLCVTEDNVNSPWLSYEAGALSQNVELLIPILFEVSPLRVSAPLRMFQSVPFGLDGMKELTYALNRSCGDKGLSSQELERRFQARYPSFEMAVRENLPESKPQPEDLSVILPLIQEEIEALRKQFAEMAKREQDSPANRQGVISSPDRENVS